MFGDTKQTKIKVIKYFAYDVYNDADYVVRSNGKWCPFYRKWQCMHQRCSDPVKYPSYVNVKVCEDWKYFSKFKSWMEKQEWEGNHLDKDLLGSGNLYSPETCCFLPDVVNYFINDKIRTSDLPKGVHRHKHYYRALLTHPLTKKKITLGYSDDPDDCHVIWLLKKKEIAQELILKFNLNKNIANALISRYSIFVCPNYDASWCFASLEVTNTNDVAGECRKPLKCQHRQELILKQTRSANENSNPY